MKKELKGLEISACGNKQSAKKLKFVGDMDTRILFLVQKMCQKETPDFISVRDIPYHSLKKLEKRLSVHYRMFIHKDFADVKQKWRYTCLQALFVKNDVDFEQIYSSDNFETTFRYVVGKMKLADKEIIFRTSHIPCVDDTRSHLNHQIDRKTAMMADEAEFQKANSDKLAICAGDYNCAAGGDFYAQQAFDSFSFQDTVTGHTYEDKTLDHVFISKALKESDISVKTRVLNDYYMQLTDHRIVSITIKVS